MIDPIEHDIVRQAQAGDKGAYDDLYLRLEPEIRRFVRRLLGGMHDALDDIVQDTFIRAYTHLHEIDPPENFRPYLFRIARNRAYDALRRIQRHPQLSLDEEPVQMHVSFVETRHQVRPDDTAHWLLLHIEVRDAMDKLSPPQREALILYSEEQLSYAEIADLVGCSIGTVKSRIYHAKRNLRGFLPAGILAVLDDEFSIDDQKTRKRTHPEIITQTKEQEDELQTQE